MRKEVGGSGGVNKRCLDRMLLAMERFREAAGQEVPKESVFNMEEMVLQGLHESACGGLALTKAAAGRARAKGMTLRSFETNFSRCSATEG
jgi:hypothetical protein